MGRAERIKFYKQIEKIRERPLIAYFTSKREGLRADMSTDALPCLIEQINQIPKKAKALDFFISSFGGDPMVAWRIMSLARQRVDKVGVLIPQSAYSAATLLAFGADEIIMHQNGHLGPVDMQITTFGEGGMKRFSTEDISAFLDFVRDNLKITDQEHIRTLFEIICKEVGSLGIGFTARSSKLAIDLGERLLALHMKDDDTRSKLRSIVQNMSRKFQSHAYPVSRLEALDIGLPVNKAPDAHLEDLMWQAWLDVEAELKERVPFNPIMELMKSAEASKLLAPAPQLMMPINAGTTSTQADVKDLQAAAHAGGGAVIETINPVDFEHINAIVESSRSGKAHVTKGKILSCRKPDLMIHYNCITASRDWQTPWEA